VSLIRRLHDPALPYTRLNLRQEVTHLLAALMEAMWIAPWFVVLLSGVQDATAPQVLLYVAANISAALLIVRLLDARGMWENLRQIVFLAGLVLALLATVGVIFPPAAHPLARPAPGDDLASTPVVTIPPLVPALILIGLVWWRGLRLALVPPTPTRIAFGMRLGILSFVAASLVPVARPVMLAALPPFFFFGLLGTSLARAIGLRESGGQAASFGPRWTVFMILAVSGITLLGVLITALVSGLDPATFSQILEPLLAAVVFFFTLLMTPIFFLLGAIVEAIIKALTAGGVLSEEEALGLGTLIEPGEPQQANRLEELLRQLQDFLAAIGGIETCLSILVLLLVVAVIVLTLRRQQRAALQEGEEREDLEGDVLGSLRDLFRRGVGAVNRALNTIGQFGLGRDLLAALTVRRAYAQMVRQAGKLGYPRAASQTPYEFRSVLHAAFPEAQEAVDTITEAYVRVHYGEAPESEDALAAVIRALDAFKAAAAPAQTRPG